MGATDIDTNWGKTKTHNMSLTGVLKLVNYIRNGQLLERLITYSRGLLDCVYNASGLMVLNRNRKTFKGQTKQYLSIRPLVVATSHMA